MAEEIKQMPKEMPKAELPKVEPKKEPPKPKLFGRVILITRDGCIVEVNGENRSLYGKKYMSHKVGEVIQL